MDLSSSSRRLAVVIPAWRPTEALELLIEQLRQQENFRILVIDDGSGSSYRPIFDRLEAAGIAVRRHESNRGKGRALKTGFNTLLTEFPECPGVVTADADGQHTPADIVRVAQALRVSIVEGRKRPVLGLRGLDTHVPLRSKFGNSITRYVFAFIIGVRITDTQTGLRGFPAALLPSLLQLHGERYEYEMAALAHLCRTGPAPRQVPIETIYTNQNRDSHFNPIRDSLSIYFVLLRFHVSSVIAFVLDLLVFCLVFTATHSLLLSVALGRIGPLLNFAINHGFVLRNPPHLLSLLVRYCALAAAIIILSYGMLYLLIYKCNWNALLAKLCIDSCLSLAIFIAGENL